MRKQNDIVVIGSMAVIFVGEDRAALIDKEDVVKVSPYRWRNMGGYAASVDAGSLHRFVMDYPEGLVVDHIHHNTMDNRKRFLKACTQRENNYNKKMPPRLYQERKGRYYPQVWFKKRLRHLGVVSTKEEAKRISNLARADARRGIDPILHRVIKEDKGVYWNERNKRWSAKIQIDGVGYALGQYDRKEDAILAVKSKREGTFIPKPRYISRGRGWRTAPEGERLERHKQIMKLHYAGLGYRRIAQALGIPRTSVIYHVKVLCGKIVW